MVNTYIDPAALKPKKPEFESYIKEITLKERELSIFQWKK